MIESPRSGGRLTGKRDEIIIAMARAAVTRYIFARRRLSAIRVFRRYTAVVAVAKSILPNDGQ